MIKMKKLKLHTCTDDVKIIMENDVETVTQFCENNQIEYWFNICPKI